MHYFYLILGLIIFLGAHSVRLFADDWRTKVRQRLGASAWKSLFSLISLAGFFLILWGFAQARQQPVSVWQPPPAMRPIAALLTLMAFVLLAAAYVPGNRIKARVQHPMVLGVIVWAAAHWLVNGHLTQMLLFGSFLLWGLADWRCARRRDRRAGRHYPGGTAGATGIAIALGVGAWIAFALWLHGLLIGVRPFG